MTPVVGPSALRKTGPFGVGTTMSAPPWVWICTTLGATLRTAALVIFSSWSLRSSCARAVPPARQPARRDRTRMRRQVISDSLPNGGPRPPAKRLLRGLLLRHLGELEPDALQPVAAL